MQVSKICQACNGMGTLRVMQIDKTPTDSECKICYSKGEHVNFRHPPRCPNCGNKRFVPLVFGDHGRTFNCPSCKYTQRFIVAQGGWLKHGSTTIKKKTPKTKYSIDEIKNAIEWRETYCRVDFYCTNEIQPNWIQVSVLSDDGILLGNGPTELDAILDAYRAYIENK